MLPNQFNQKNIKEDNVPLNQLSQKNIKENKECLNQFISKDKDYNTFPIGTKYEEELNSDFKYFNVFWYFPDKTNYFNNFKKCFENVKFYKGNVLNATIDFFEKESVSEWIVITPGSKGKELIQHLEKNNCIKSFFIYCNNTESHEEWAKKIKKVGCITSDLEILCQKFIEINKSYFIPNFNYDRKTNDNILINNSEINFENMLSFNSPLITSITKTKNKRKNKYNNFCVKLFNYLNGNEIMNDLKEAMRERNSVLNFTANFVSGQENAFLLSTIELSKNLTLLSFYFNKYQYLLNLLSYQEIKDLFKVSVTPVIIYNSQMKIIKIMEKFSKKILRKESILDEKEDLKEIHTALIFIISSNLRKANQNLTTFINYYQIVNFFRDIDFCFKIYATMINAALNNKKFNIVDEITFSLSICDPRYIIYIHYLYQFAKNSEFSEEEQNIITDTLTIKDFIVLGDQKFQEKIKIVEDNVISKSFKYLNINEISNYLEEKRKEKGVKILTYFYFLIIRFDEYQKNLEKLILLSLESGITFLAFLYIENEDILKVPKKLINYLSPTILVYSNEDIINYLSQKLNFYNPLRQHDLSEVGEYLNIKYSKNNLWTTRWRKVSKWMFWISRNIWC